MVFKEKSYHIVHSKDEVEREMSREIILGRWGDIASLVMLFDEKNKKIENIRIVSKKKILKDRFNNYLFEGEENLFMKAIVVSEKRDGKWILDVTVEEIKEIGMRLSKRKIFFEPSQEFLDILRSYSNVNSTIIVGLRTSIIPA